MSKTHNKAHLPANPTLKEINWFKKQLNWGELPPFYHLVASSLSESEGMMEHGFDNAIKNILKKRNWNLEALGGVEDENGIIHCENKPRLALYQTFTARGYELWAYPYLGEKKIDEYMKEKKNLEFNVWDPNTMKVLIRINQLHKFIAFHLEQGDKADKALIMHSHKVVHKVIEFLKKELNIVQIAGVSIPEFYKRCEKGLALNAEVTLAQLMKDDD